SRRSLGPTFFPSTTLFRSAVLPAMFVAFYPQLQALNIMRLSSPESAILSAIIFNALVIVALIPLALKGVKYRAIGAAALLRRNLDRKSTRLNSSHVKISYA